MKTEELKKKLQPKPKVEPSSDDWLSSGSTRLNLACTGHPKRAFLKGKFYHLIGKSNSGKTWIAHSVIAEACRLKAFDNYQFIYDNPEDGALFDLETFFGKETARRIEPPAGTKENPIYSKTVEEMYFRLDEKMKKGPVIWIEDSMDGLRCQADDEKYQEDKTAFFKNKKTAGSYGMGKPKKNSQNLPRITADIRDTGSMLFIISQTRANIGFGAAFNPDTRAGGIALQFWATIEMWTSIKKTLTKNVRGKDRQIGILTQVHVKRSRVTGKDRTVEFPIYHSHGIDDTGSLVDWLVEEKHWQQKDKGVIIAPEFNLELGREKLIEKIEENNQENELRALAKKVWDELEKACEVKRKKRYI